jgi:hypothetical protein
MSRSTNVASPVFAKSPATSTATGFMAFAVAAVLTVAAVIALVALSAWGPMSTEGAQAVDSRYGEGYPLHGGLAGPSRISVWEQYPSYGEGYPLHGGLAGPSRSSTVDHRGYGAGYPLHGGLAGPSQVDE